VLDFDSVLTVNVAPVDPGVVKFVEDTGFVGITETVDIKKRTTVSTFPREPTADT
jgi:hypothetical protein